MRDQPSINYACLKCGKTFGGKGSGKCLYCGGMLKDSDAISQEELEAIYAYKRRRK